MVGPQPLSNSPRSSPSSNTLISSSFNPCGGGGGNGSISSGGGGELKQSSSQHSFNSNNYPSNCGSSPHSNTDTPTGRKVRTLYACVGENATELTFEPNTLIFNGKAKIDTN